MTSRERIQAALAHRQPDRTPIFEYVMHTAVAEAFLGRPFADDAPVFERLVRERGVEETVRRRAVDLLDMADLFGFDMLYFHPLPAMPHATACSRPRPRREGAAGCTSGRERKTVYCSRLKAT